MEGTIHISNIAYVTKGKKGVSTKIGYIRTEKGLKKRISRRTGKEI